MPVLKAAMQSLMLFGDYNLPVSRLPTFGGQIPTYYSHLNTGRPYNPGKPNKYTSRYFDLEWPAVSIWLWPELHHLQRFGC